MLVKVLNDLSAKAFETLPEELIRQSYFAMHGIEHLLTKQNFFFCFLKVTTEFLFVVKVYI